MGNLLATMRPTVVGSAGDHPSDEPSGVLDQSKLRMRSAISPRPTSHSLESSSNWASLRNSVPRHAHIAKAHDYGQSIRHTEERSKTEKVPHRPNLPTGGFWTPARGGTVRRGWGAGVRKPFKEETAGRTGAVWLGAPYGDL